MVRVSDAGLSPTRTVRVPVAASKPAIRNTFIVVFNASENGRTGTRTGLPSLKPGFYPRTGMHVRVVALEQFFINPLPVLAPFLHCVGILMIAFVGLFVLAPGLITPLTLAIVRSANRPHDTCANR